MEKDPEPTDPRLVPNKSGHRRWKQRPQPAPA